MATDLARRSEKEQKQLARLKKKAAIPYPAYYLGLITVVITLMHSMDEMTSKVSDNLRTPIINEFFVRGMGLTYTDGLQTMNTIMIAMFVLQLVSPFYKILADKYGRKLFLVLNVFGMAVGLFLGYLAKSLPMYIAASTVVGFFVLHDVQIIYILEVAPAEKRSRLYGVVKAIGTFGMFLVPLFMGIFMGADETKWRLVFGACAAVGVVLTIIGLFFARESDVFLQQRIKELETPLEERLAAAEAAKTDKKAIKGGVAGSFRYLFGDKDMRWLFIASMFCLICIMPFAANAEPIMSTSGMELEARTQAFYVFPFVYAAIIFVCGFLGDWIGRKNTVLLNGIVSLTSFVLFIIACKNGWSPWLVGVLYGCYLGCYFTINDYMGIMMKEKSPTEIRASISGVAGLLTMVVVMAGMIAFNIMIGSMPISTAALILAVPGITIGLIILMLKVKETNGVDLDTVGRSE